MAHRTRKQILPPSKPTTSCELSSQRPSSLPSGTTDVATNCLEVGQVCFRPSTALASSCVVRTDSVRDCVTDSCRCGRPVSTLDPPMKPTPTSRAANNTGRSVSRATASLVWGPLASFSGACLEEPLSSPRSIDILLPPVFFTPTNYLPIASVSHLGAISFWFSTVVQH